MPGRESAACIISVQGRNVKLCFARGERAQELWQRLGDSAGDSAVPNGLMGYVCRESIGREEERERLVSGWKCGEGGGLGDGSGTVWIELRGGGMDWKSIEGGI